MLLASIAESIAQMQKLIGFVATAVTVAVTVAVVVVVVAVVVVVVVVGRQNKFMESLKNAVKNDVKNDAKKIVEDLADQLRSNNKTVNLLQETVSRQACDPYDEISASSVGRRNTATQVLRAANQWKDRCLVLTAYSKGSTNQFRPKNLIGAHIVPHSIVKHWSQFGDQLAWDDPRDVDSASNLLPMEKSLEAAMDQRLWCFVPQGNAPTTRFSVKVFPAGEKTKITVLVGKQEQKKPLSDFNGVVVDMPDYVSRTALQFMAFYFHRKHRQLRSFHDVLNGFRRPGDKRNSPEKEKSNAMLMRKANGLRNAELEG